MSFKEFTVFALFFLFHKIIIPVIFTVVKIIP